jgi:ABC-2 type transport system ATP-binding protein
MIEKGVLVECSTVAEILKRVRQRTLLEIGVVGDPEPAARLLEQSSLVENVEIRDGRVMVTLAEGVIDYTELSTVLVQAGHKLSLFKEDEINLETAFMALTKGITA